MYNLVEAKLPTAKDFVDVMIANLLSGHLEIQEPVRFAARYMFAGNKQFKGGILFCRIRQKVASYLATVPMAAACHLLTHYRMLPGSTLDDWLLAIFTL